MFYWTDLINITVKERVAYMQYYVANFRTKDIHKVLDLLVVPESSCPSDRTIDWVEARYLITIVMRSFQTVSLLSRLSALPKYWGLNNFLVSCFYYYNYYVTQESKIIEILTESEIFQRKNIRKGFRNRRRHKNILS